MAYTDLAQATETYAFLSLTVGIVPVSSMGLPVTLKLYVLKYFVECVS